MSRAGKEQIGINEMQTLDQPRQAGSSVEQPNLEKTIIVKGEAVTDSPEFTVDTSVDVVRVRLTNLLGPNDLAQIEQALSMHTSNDHAAPLDVNAALSIIFAGRQQCVDQVRPIFFDNAELKKLIVSSGKYFVRKLGQGKFGSVVLVFDKHAPPETALRVMKVLHTPVTEYDESEGQWYTDSEDVHTLANIARFNRDAKAHAVLGESSLGVSPQLFEKGVVTWEDGKLHPYITMRYLPGHTLSAWMGAAHKHGRVPLPLVADMGTLYAIKLAQAHDRRFVHRDLSPGNLYLPDASAPLVLDWGLSVEPTGTDRFTQQYTIMGTPNYMSPELASNAADVSYPSDVYQLAAVLYHLTMGRPLFDGKGEANGKLMMALLQQHISEVPNLQDFGWYAPDALKQAFARALEKDPLRRQGMADFAEQLYGMSNLRHRTGKSFGKFMQMDHADMAASLPIPEELQRQRESLERDQPIPSWYARPRAGETTPRKNGGVEDMVAFHLSSTRGDIRYSTRKNVYRVLRWTAGGVLASTALALGLSSLFSKGDSGAPISTKSANDDTVIKTPLHAPAPHHPQRIVTEADEKGRVKDLKIFAGLPIEISIDDENALLCTADGKVRSVLLHLSGEQLARILGRQSAKDIPEPELQNGQPAMLFLGADGKWVLAINGNVAYVVGRASADARGSMGTVYSDREDIKAALSTERFREAERTSDYLADPDLHDVLQSMPMLQCSDGNRPGLLGDTRAQNLRNMNMVVEHIRGQLRQPQHSGK